MAPLTLYHLQDSRSFRIAWLLQELGISHEVVYAKREGNKAPTKFKTKHAMGKAPMLVHEDGDTIIIESGAQCEYLVEAYASSEQQKQLWSGGSAKAKAEVRSWMWFAEGTLLTHALPITYTRWNLPEEHKEALPAVEKALAVNVNNDLNFVEAALAKNTYVVGEALTLADIMLAFSAQFVLARGLGAKWEESTYPNIKRWIRMLRKREGWRLASKQGEDSYTLDALTP